MCRRVLLAVMGSAKHRLPSTSSPSSNAGAGARAAAADGSPVWPDTILAAAAWFLGANDAAQRMWDPEIGGDSTGYTPTG
jgi:hypothetical protein